MLASIKNWFVPPFFEGDEEKTRLARFMNLSMVIVVACPLISIFGILLVGKTYNYAISIAAITVAAGLLLRSSLHSGRIKIAGTGLILLSFMATSAAIINLGTIRAPITASYLFVVILAGVLFDWRGIVTCALACSLAVLGLIFAENAGLLPVPDYTVTLTQWVTYTAMFLLTGSFSYYTNQVNHQSLVYAHQEITERKRAENELRKLSQAIEQSPWSMMITDLKGSIEYANLRFTKVTGYSFNEAKTLCIMKNDPVLPKIYRQLWDTIQSGNEWRGELVNKKKDGSVYFESTVISPITDENGISTHYLAITEDITERKKNEMHLAEMRSRLQLLGDNLEEAALYVYSHDATGKPHFEYLSAGMEKMTGVKAEDVLHGESIRLHSLIFPEFMPDLAAREAKSKAELTSFKMEVRQRHAITGKIYWSLLRSTPRRRPDGSTVWYGVQIDITDKKRNENLLQQANEQLRQQNEYLSVLHQVTLDLLNHRHVDDLLHDIVDQSVILFDAPFSELMLEKEGELVVQAFRKNQDFIKGDHIKRTDAKLCWTAFDTKLPAVLSDYSVYPFRRKIHDELTLHAVANFPVLVRGKCIGILALGRSQAGYIFNETQIQNGMLFAQLVALVLDNAQLLSAAEHEITERIQVEDTLKEANGQLRSQMKEIERLQEELREQSIRTR